MPVDTRADGRRQAYEDRQANARAAVPEPMMVSQGELRAYLGDQLFARIGFAGMDGDLCDSALMRDRYFSEGGLTRFLSEGFPATTSLKPFGHGQLRAISIVESVIRNGGIEQSLEPRAFAKSSRVARAAIWAMLGEYRRCAVVFQSSQPKAVETLTKIKNELSANPFLRALSPAICTACRHAAVNPGLHKRQHYQGDPTNIVWLKETIRLPDIMGERGGGGRLLCLPFDRAAGIALSDPVTLQDLRPDLMLPDDVQAHSDASSPRVTEKLLSIWHGSVKYLCGRGKSAATVFVQTIFEVDDMADQLSRDPSVHTIRYPFLEEFPTDKAWWQGEYKKTLLGYDQLDPDGQVKARDAANELYRSNREKADEGAKVSWEHAYDPATAVSAIQQAMNNYLTNETAFFAQDQNNPEAAAVSEGDIRARPAEIRAKLHPEKRYVVPEWANKLVCHIDVHDSLLYYVVCAGNSTMQMAMIDRQTFPPQKQAYFSLREAHNTIDCIPKYAELPTMQDRIRAALADLAEFLLVDQQYKTEDGAAMKFTSIAIDCGDGDHWETVHSFVKQSPHTSLIPMRGVAKRASQTPLNEQAKSKTERRRGDHWTERMSERTKCLWIQFDANYYKMALHRGLRAPLGTTESVSLWHTTSERTHHMTAEHCNAEIPTWCVAKRVNDTTNGVYEWATKPSCDNHILDGTVGCLVLLNYTGGTFAGVAPKKKRKRVKASELQRQRRLERSKR